MLFKRSSTSGSLYQLFSLKIPLGTVGDVPVSSHDSPTADSRYRKIILMIWFSDTVIPSHQIVLIHLFLVPHLRDTTGIYVSIRDLPCVTCDKSIIIGIYTGRVLYESIFVCKVLRVITQRCIRARSLIRLDWIRRFSSNFECSWPLIINYWIQSLRRR